MCKQLCEHRALRYHRRACRRRHAADALDRCLMHTDNDRKSKQPKTKTRVSRSLIHPKLTVIFQNLWAPLFMWGEGGKKKKICSGELKPNYKLQPVFAGPQASHTLM